MKKIVLISIALGLFLLLTSEKNLRLCKKMVGYKTSSQNIQTDEYFKNLSQYYYGTPLYSEELSLVNATLSISEDELIIPSIESINKLKNKQTISDANGFYSVQQTGADSYATNKEIKYTKNIKKSSVLPKPLVIIIISVAFALISIYLSRKNRATIY